MTEKLAMTDLAATDTSPQPLPLTARKMIVEKWALKLAVLAEPDHDAGWGIYADWLNAFLADIEAPSASRPPTAGQGSEKIWFCKIGGVVKSLPDSADFPMRQAIRRAFREVTGCDDAFCFSGWAGSLTEGERSVVTRKTKLRVAPPPGETP